MVLHQAQGIFGFLPMPVQKYVADKMDIPLSEIYGVVTFYSYFTMIPKGRFPISICTGTACYVRGAEKVLDEFKKQLGISVGQTSDDGKFSLSCLRCVGACGLAPVILVGEKVYGRVAPDGVKAILDAYKDK
jgi:NADH-quinone oxidoreductase subunit E/NADP-reducing hydrogenase subunit HndA